MAGRIRGITIEIGGDTTKLDKALRDTNNELSSTQRILKDVERKLKMDPKNVDLLAQKEKYLGAAAKEAAQKVDILKAALKNADQALARNQDYEAAYEPLKQELDSVTTTMKGLEKDADSMKLKLELGQISTEAYDQFNQELEESRKRVKELTQEANELNRKFSERMSVEEIEGLQRELAAATDEMKKANQASRQFSSGLEALGTRASDISSKAKTLSDAFAPVTKAVAGIGVAAVATVPATEELRADLSFLDTNAQQAGVGLGTARAAFEALTTVSGETDSAVEAVSNLLQAGFDDSSMQAAVEGLSNAVISFPDTIKIESLADSIQETLAAGSATGQFAELLDRMGVGADAFSASLAQCNTETDKQSLVLSQLVSGPLAGAYESWRSTNGELVANRESTLRFQQAMADLAETIQPMVTMAAELASGFLEWFADLDEGTQRTIITIGALIAAVSPIAGALSKVSGVMSIMAVKAGGLAIANGAVQVSLSSWLPVIAAVLIALAALGAMIHYLMGESDELASADLPVSDLPAGSRTAARRSVFGLPSGEGLVPDSVPYLAAGAVIPPNRPYLAVVGDQTSGTNVEAPVSVIEDAVTAAMARQGGGGGGTTAVNISFSGSLAQLARILQPEIAVETSRRGPSLIRGGNR